MVDVIGKALMAKKPLVLCSNDITTAQYPSFGDGKCAVMVPL